MSLLGISEYDGIILKGATASLVAYGVYRLFFSGRKRSGLDKSLDAISRINIDDYSSRSNYIQAVGKCFTLSHEEGEGYFKDGTKEGSVLSKVQVPSDSIRGGVVIDCGGHYGGFALAALRRGSSHIYIYEAAPSNFAVLSTVIDKVDPERNFVTVHHKAVGDFDGEISFTEFENPAFSMLNTYRKEQLKIVQDHILSENHLLHIVNHPEAPKSLTRISFLPNFLLRFLFKLANLQKLAEKRKNISVPIVRLSSDLRDVFDKHDKISLLKVDIEGAEFDCINGINDENWPKIQQVVAEVDDRKPYNFLKPWLAKMKSVGFTTVEYQENHNMDMYIVYASR